MISAIILTKEREDELISQLFNNPKTEGKSDTTLFSLDLNNTFTRLYYKKHNQDLYIFLVDEIHPSPRVETD